MNINKFIKKIIFKNKFILLLYMILSLVLVIIFFVIFIFLIILTANYFLRYMVDKTINSENFTNKKDITHLDNSIVNPVDDCRKIDNLSENQLNFQTGTNIPLSPNTYKNYVGDIYVNDDIPLENPFEKGNVCLKKPKLLYDGIWNSNQVEDSPYKIQEWNLTNGNLTNGYYCSDKLIQVNQPFNKNFVDMSATPPIIPSKYYTYFNDRVDDINDTEIHCFPGVFNAGITEDLKHKF
jgi:hypothetical protein